MSSMVPFTGLNAGTGNGGANPFVNQLRRIGAFRQGVAARDQAMNDYREASQHAHDLQKDLITHAGREDRRGQTHAAKMRGQMLRDAVSAGADPAAPGRTRVKMDGLEVETARPEPKAKKAKTKTSGPSKSQQTPPTTMPLTPKFQSP